MAISLTAWIIVGAIAGWLANLLLGEQLKAGCVGLVLLGMVGAVLGGVLFGFLGGKPVTGLNAYSVVVSLVGALLLLWLVRLATGD